MSIVDQIINLNTVAMMGGTELERFYVTQKELEEICKPGELEVRFGCKSWFAGYVDGVLIIVNE